jgi:thioredoxin-related protein
MKNTPILVLVFLCFCFVLSCQKSEQTAQNEADILPFNEQANANLDIQRAIERATLTNKKILLVFGANWCKWCKALHKFVETDEEINHVFHQTFEVVWIDVGRRDKNMKIDERYGSPASSGGIPVFVILDSKGTFLTTQKIDFFEELQEEDQPVGYDREKFINFIKGWTGVTRA